MKIGILSDSHDNFNNICKAVDIFNERDVDYVLHAGDIVSAAGAAIFSKLKKAEFIAVFGNSDYDKLEIKKTIENFGGSIHSKFFAGEIDESRFYMVHRPGAIEATSENGLYDVIIYGHTHKQDIRKIANTLIINPGETGNRNGKHATVVILDLESGYAENIRL